MGVCIRVNPCNLRLLNDLVKDNKGKAIDSNSQDGQNNYERNHYIDIDKTIEVDTENFSNKFEEQKDK